MKKRSLVTIEAANRQHQNPRITTTHPTTSHNIKLNQKGGCARLFGEQQRMYANFIHVYVNFGQKLACIH